MVKGTIFLKYEPISCRKSFISVTFGVVLYLLYDSKGKTLDNRVESYFLPPVTESSVLVLELLRRNVA